MIIDGEKWACEACVRGHRVSNCQHYDRPLQHINKKGRPVTQCQHCRAQRKNRAAHVKCDCGEKTTKCVHLGAIEGHRESCCCNHGGRCSCAFKKDLDPVPETAGYDAEAAAAESVPAAACVSAASREGNSSSSKTPIRRRRANTTRSEGTLSFDEHGRRKPISHKHHTKAVSQKTAPYPINRLSSVRSTGGLSGFLTTATNSANEDEDAEDDDHSSGNTGSDSGLDDDGASSYLADAVATSTGTSAPSFLPPQLSQQQQQQQQEQHQQHQQEQQRRSRSETASPLLFSGSFPQPHQVSVSNPLSPLNMGVVNLVAYPNYNSFGTDQAEQPLFSAGLTAPSVDWSQFFGAGLSGSSATANGTANDADRFGTGSFSFPRAFGYEYNGSEQAPTMTTATSGEVSEAEDFMAPGLDDYEYDFDGAATDAASSSVAFSRTNSSYQLPAAAVNMRGAGNSSNDYNELRILKASNKFLPTPNGAAGDDISILSATAGMPNGAGIDDDDAAIWLPEYQGLPSMTESPESDVISFWDTK